MQNMGYSDVLSMPTYERRFYLSQLTRDFDRKNERMEEMRQEQLTRDSGGGRKKRVSGEALKTKIKTGELPIT